MVCRSWSTHPAHVESIDTVTAWIVLSWYVDRGAHIRHMTSQLTLSLLGVSCLGMSIVEHTSKHMTVSIDTDMCLECLVLVCRSWSTHPTHVESIDTVTAWIVLSWYVDRGAHIRHMTSQLTLSLLGVSCLGMSIVEHTSGTCRVN